MNRLSKIKKLVNNIMDTMAINMTNILTFCTFIGVVLTFLASFNMYGNVHDSIISLCVGIVFMLPELFFKRRDN